MDILTASLAAYPKRLKPLLAICCLLFVPQLTAQENAENWGIELKTKVASLVTSPNVCELADDQVLCEMNASLLWEVPKAADFCLWDTEQDSPLRCWQNAWSGTLQLRFVSGHNRTYLLTRGQNGSVAAKATIQVMGALEQRLRARRRRSFWRLF